MTSSGIVRIGDGFGMIFPVGTPPEQAQREFDQAYARHVATAVAEGLCPHHGGQLEPVATNDGSTAGRCAACRAWWRTTADEVSWDLGYDPHTGQPVMPGWVAPA